MKLKITRSSLLTVPYMAIVINVVLGMVFKFVSLGVLRKAFIASKILLLINIILFGLIEFIKFSKFRFKVNLDSVLLAIFVIYEICISKIRGLLIFPDAYLDILIWPMIYILFRNYTRRYDIPQIFGKLVMTTMACILLLSLPLIVKHRSGFGDVGGVIFYVYYCVAFLPMVLFTIENNKTKNILFLLTIFVLAISTKRSGTVVAVIGYVIYLFTNVRVRKDIKNKLEKYWKYILAFSIAALLVIALDQLFSFSIISRLKSIGADRGSGREAIWIEVFEAFLRSPFDTKLFGHGYQAVYYRLKPYGVDRLAHNSFIEFLYDYGYVGLGFFLSFFSTQIMSGLKAVQKKNPHAPEMLYSLLVALVFGMSSYFFEESTIIVPIAAFWGCFAGMNSRKRKIRTESTKS